MHQIEYIKPVVVLTVDGKHHEGWMDAKQTAAFFNVSVRDLPNLVEKGLHPPVKLTPKNQRYALSWVYEYSVKMKGA